MVGSLPSVPQRLLKSDRLAVIILVHRNIFEHMTTSYAIHLTMGNDFDLSVPNRTRGEFLTRSEFIIA